MEVYLSLKTVILVQRYRAHSRKEVGPNFVNIEGLLHKSGVLTYCLHGKINV